MLRIAVSAGMEVAGCFLYHPDEQPQRLAGRGGDMLRAKFRSNGAYGAAGVLAALAWLAGGALASAQRSVEAIVNDTGPDRQKRLEEGARREGTLLLYTTGTQIKPLLDRFLQKYPFLKVELAR